MADESEGNRAHWTSFIPTVPISTKHSNTRLWINRVFYFKLTTALTIAGVEANSKSKELLEFEQPSIDKARDTDAAATVDKSIFFIKHA